VTTNRYILTIISVIIVTTHLFAQEYPPLPLQKENGRTILPICSSFPQLGENSIMGRQMLAGVENYLREYKHFAAENSESHKKTIIKLIKNNPDIGDKGLENLNDLTKQTPLIVGLIGHSTITSLIPQLQQHNIALLFPLESEASLRTLNLDNVIYFRPSNEKQLAALAHHAIDSQHKTKIAIFYESSRWGEALLTTLKKILKDEYDITPVATAAYAQGTLEIEEAIKTISKATPNAIFCLAHPRPAYSFISSALNTGLHECLFLGISQLAVIQKLLSTARGLDIAVASVVPNVNKSRLPIAQEYKQAMRSFLSFRDDSPFYFEAFINMALFEECIKQIIGPLSLSKIIKTFESWENVNFKGLSISFNSADRSLSSAIWINPGVDREWIEFKE
jgi:ABC-type branched-subunit amino acid transport system substrate-binding protein